MTNDILIFIEQREDKVHPAALQCATPAQKLAGKTGGKVVACVIGDAIDNAVAAAEQTGVERIVTISDPALKDYSALRYTTAVASVMDKVDPRIVLLPTTFMGRDLSPRIALRRKGAVATDVVELDVDADGQLDVVRPLYNGKASCHVKFPADKPAIVTVRANTFPASSGGSGAAREELPYTAQAGDDRIVVKEIVKAGGDVKDVTEGDIIVSGGRALKNEDNFKIIYDLAKELDAAVGASRAACDAGLSAAQSPGRPDRQDGHTEIVHCLRYKRGDPAPRRDARLEDDRRNQYRSRSPALQCRGLRHRRRPFQSRSGYDGGDSKAEGIDRFTRLFSQAEELPAAGRSARPLF